MTHPGSNDIVASVVVPVRNHAAGLERLIQRLRAQTLGCVHFEVIVADDGSTDGSVGCVRSDGKWLRISRGPQRNSYAARNRGAKLARGRVLAFTDADCLPRPDWLEEGLAALTSADLVGGQVELVLPTRPTVWTLIDAMQFNQERFVAIGKAATANLFVTRTLFERHGGFDPTLPSGGDWEFVDRSLRSGGRLVFAPNAVVEHATRDQARDFLLRRWRVEQAFARRSKRIGASLATLNLVRESIAPRRLGFAVGYDLSRVVAVGLPGSWRLRLLSVPARYVAVPAVDASAQVVGWLRARKPSRVPLRGTGGWLRDSG